MVTQKIQDIQNEYESVKGLYEKKKEEHELVERELRKLQERYREALQTEYQLNTAKEHLEASLRVAQEELQKYNDFTEGQASQWKKERGDLSAKVQELMAENERTRAEAARQVQNMKGKYSEYKSKLKKANQSIQTLTARVAKYELEAAAEREDRYAAAKENMRRGANEGGINFQMLENDPLNNEISKLLEGARAEGNI